MTGFGLLLIAEFSSAKYLLVDIGDDVEDRFRPINGDGLDLSNNAKDPKGISYPFRIIKLILLITTLKFQLTLINRSATF